MFGENSIYGSGVYRVDEKNRISLPIFTGAEPEDQLVLLNRKDYVKVISKLQMDELIEDLLLAFEKANNEERDIIEAKMLELCDSVLKHVKVDGNRRIVLNKDLTETGYIRVIGVKNSIYLKKELKNNL